MLHEEVIKSIYKEQLHNYGAGKVADYIPALSKIDPKKFAISICDIEGGEFSIGDSDTKFTIQSISKVFTLAMVIAHIGDELWNCVGREPSGSAFNSLILLEQERGFPRNPFLNAGAFVVTDKLIDLYNDPKSALIDFVQELSNDTSIGFDLEVAQSELDTSFRNMALVNLMKSYGTVSNSVDRIIDIYTNQCSVAMTTKSLARSFLFLANGGVTPYSGREIIAPRMAKRLNALMLTCGLYNESGDFAYRVGVPGKSGVGGGIVAVIPGRLSIAVWSPELNKNGNSLRGIDCLEEFTTKIGISVF